MNNSLEIHKEAGNHPALQGGRKRQGYQFEFLQEHWSPAARLVAGVAGVSLAVYGEMYCQHTKVDVKSIEKNKRILIEWNGPENPSSVEWTFEDKDDNTLFVIVKNWGFGGDTNKVVAEAIDSTGGFTFLLAALKVFLESESSRISFLITPQTRLSKDGWHAERFDL